MALLTIAIPTFNRSKFLDLALLRINEEITSLCESQRALVRIYVSDNASSDDTPLITLSYQIKTKVKFDIVRNKENIGAERNVKQCYTSATTPYVWILGDDDVIVPGGLQKVLQVLQNNQVDILYVNAHWFVGEYSWSPNKFEKQKIIIYKNALSFARRINVKFTFISSLIVRSGVNIKCFAKFTDGSHLPQFGWVLPLLQDSRCFISIENTVIAAKGSNSSGYSLVKVFGYNLKNITDNILNNRLNIAKSIQNGAIVNFFPSFIINERKGSYRFEDKNMKAGLHEVFGDNWRYYLFLYPLFSLPVFALNSYNKLMSIGRRIFPL